MDSTTTVLAGLSAALSAVSAGLVLIGIGQVFGALREIALNTRAANPSAAPNQTQYGGLSFIAQALSVVGVMVMIVGVSVGGMTAVKAMERAEPAPAPAAPSGPARPRFDARGYPIP